MALSELDRSLLERCLAKRPKAWEEFVDRFLGLMVHVVNHTSGCRSIRLTVEDREDLVAHIFLHLVKDNMAILRHFRGDSSLAPYLTVIARRLVVQEMLRRKSPGQLPADSEPADDSDTEERFANREQVERLLEELADDEARVVRMYHLEGKSYREISGATGLPENTIGPTLTRARRKLRSRGADRAAP